jgi:hypothetical protein
MPTNLFPTRKTKEEKRVQDEIHERLDRQERERAEATKKKRAEELERLRKGDPPPPPYTKT